MDCFLSSKRADILYKIEHDQPTTIPSPPPTLSSFKFSEVKRATRRFKSSRKIGQGEFGGLYKGTIKQNKEKIHVVIQQIRGTILEAKSYQDWLRQVTIQADIQHPNLVKLVGYCSGTLKNGESQRYLIQEYVHNGSVDNHLFNASKSPLPWENRLTIALDVARGMAYLHEGMDNHQIVFRCFKSSIVLLDENFNAKLSDYAMARLGPFPGVFVETKNEHVLACGQLDYYMGSAAPEFFSMHKVTWENDVWGYGVFLLQLITGRRAFDRNLPRNEQNLVHWVKRRWLSDKKMLEEEGILLDPRLEGRYCAQSSMGLGAIAKICLEEEPKLRPKMSEVLQMVCRIVKAAEIN